MLGEAQAVIMCRLSGHPDIPIVSFHRSTVPLVFILCWPAPPLIFRSITRLFQGHCRTFRPHLDSFHLAHSQLLLLLFYGFIRGSFTADTPDSGLGEPNVERS